MLACESSTRAAGGSTGSAGCSGCFCRPSSLNDVVDESLQDSWGRKLVLQGSTDTVDRDLHEDG
jgi:hypothetical protein